METTQVVFLRWHSRGVREVYTKYLLKPEQLRMNKHSGSTEAINLMNIGGEVGRGDQAMRLYAVPCGI